jgi:hypothetical protein
MTNQTPKVLLAGNELFLLNLTPAAPLAGVCGSDSSGIFPVAGQRVLSA